MAPHFDEQPTLRENRPHVSSTPTERVNLDAVTLEDAGHATRYHVGDALGAGGMGEVRRCRDRRVGREVAMKVVRAEHRDDVTVRARFLREARVQGQLEHPCIVPVYDIGLGADGVTYFTMKRIRGRTLESIIDGIAAGDADTMARWSRRKLLAALSTVCGAIEYAHTRGVVHRDIKPGNVMLGEFGEVYVLDWGVARIVDVADDVPERVDAPSMAGRTAQGAIVGTPGYMAPEQLMAEHDLDGRADVYSLGALLFEVLALQPLHPGTTVDALIYTTLAGVDARPSARAPGVDVPPELDALCVRATAVDRASRIESARALRDALERYLDGDRDTERRRALAEEHATTANVYARAALAGDDASRPAALREVGRALAYDPANGAALGTFVELMLAPPRVVPPEVNDRMNREALVQLQAGARAGTRSYLTWLCLMPLVLVLGLRDWRPMALSAFFTAACAALSAWQSRATEVSPASQYALLALNLAGIASTYPLFGPFVLVPGVIFGVTAAFSLAPYHTLRRMYAAMGAVALVAPVLLDLSGLTAPSLVFRDGAMTTLPRVANFPPGLTLAALTGAHVAGLFIMVKLFTRIRTSFDEASRRLHVFAWQLRQIVPREARNDATT